MAYIYGGICLLFLLLGGYAFYQNRHISGLEHDKAVLQAGLTKAIDANADQMLTINTLESANREFARDARVQATEYLATVADLARANAKRQELQSTLAKLEAKDFQLPACKALLDTDLAAVCPDVAAAAKERAK